jgi:hypothetical protein
MMVISFPVFELLKEGEVLVVPTDNPMTEKEVWLAFRDVVHGLEYRELKTNNWLLVGAKRSTYYILVRFCCT